MAHTPGPWMVRKSREGRRTPQLHIVDVESGDSLAAINGLFAECEANAKLMAVAPDMLAALELAYKALALANYPKVEEALEAVSEAIVKAKATS